MDKTRIWKKISLSLTFVTQIIWNSFQRNQITSVSGFCRHRPWQSQLLSGSGFCKHWPWQTKFYCPYLSLPTIETCFNWFGTCSSDAKIIKRRLFHPGNSKVTQNLSTPPPSGGRAGVAKMAPVPDGEIFSPTTLALWVKTLFSFNCLNLKQFKQYTAGYRSGPLQQVWSGT